MRRLAIAATLIALTVGPVLAQSPPDGTPTRIRGTVEKLKGQNLTVKSREGQSVSVALAPNVEVITLVKKSLADIEPGFVASTGVKDKDGKISEIEARIFPARTNETPQIVAYERRKTLLRQVSAQSANPTCFSYRNSADFRTRLGAIQSERKTHVFRQSPSAVHGRILRAKSDPFRDLSAYATKMRVSLLGPDLPLRARIRGWVQVDPAHHVARRLYVLGRREPCLVAGALGAAHMTAAHILAHGRQGRGTILLQCALQGVLDRIGSGIAELAPLGKTAAVDADHVQGLDMMLSPDRKLTGSPTAIDLICQTGFRSRDDPDAIGMGLMGCAYHPGVV